jgi:spore germination protein KC
MFRKPKIKMILLLPFLLGGCWDLKEIDHLYYVHSVGVDYINEKYLVYAQIADFSTLAKTESGGQQGGGKVWVGKGVGKTLEEAIHNLYSSSERTVSWGHLTSLVFSERALDYIMKDVIDLLKRYHEIRLTDWVFATDAPMQEIFTALPIVFESSLFSQLGDPVDVHKQRSFIRPIRVHEMLRSMSEPGHSVLIPNLTISKENWSGENGIVPALKISGAYTVKGYRKTSKLKDKQLAGLRWMDSATSRAVLSIYKHRQPIAELICTNPKISVKPQISRGKVSYDVQVKVMGNIMIMKNPLSESYLQRAAEKEIARQIRHTYREGLKVKEDLYNFSYLLYRKHPRVWRQLAEQNKLFLTEDSLRSIKVKVTINTGKEKMNEVQRIKRGFSND